MIVVRVVVASILLATVFWAGAWYGARDRVCVTADSGGMTVVYCATGSPAAEIER